jgi:hypothetical protein
MLRPGYDDDLSLTTPNDAIRKSLFSAENLRFQSEKTGSQSKRVLEP